MVSQLECPFCRRHNARRGNNDRLRRSRSGRSPAQYRLAGMRGKRKSARRSSNCSLAPIAVYRPAGRQRPKLAELTTSFSSLTTLP